VDAVIILPKTTNDIAEQLSSLHATEKQNNTKALMQILSTIKLLCRQGLPLRGDKDESDSNFMQLLLLKAELDPILAQWLKRKENVYTSATIQLVLVMPATNATSERSFSALRRVKSYLRSTMLQERLNYLMLLHVHKEYTDVIDLKHILNEFVSIKAQRKNTFKTFS
jgi:hypothetical protein